MNELIHLAGAIALLLWSIRMVKTGFERAYERRLENAIRVMTRNRPQAMILGVSSAAALQSSTAVVLLAAGFVATGALGVVPALSLVVGAEIGSSLMALILSFDLSIFSPFLLLIGYLSFQKASRRTFKYWGRICMGLGLLLLALTLISQATAGMRSGNGMDILLSILGHDAALTLFLVALLTWIVHSSLAVILIVAHLASSGSIPLDMSIMMVLGANMGGALPALSSGWGLNQKGRLIILGNLIIRLGAVCIGLGIYCLQMEQLVSLDELKLDSPMVFHLFINTLNGMIFLISVSYWAKVLENHFPAPVEKAVNKPIGSVYLSQDDIGHPVRAMANVRNETLRIADIAFQMLEGIPSAFENSKKISKIKQLDDDIDHIHREVTYYLSYIENFKTTKEAQNSWQDAFNFATNLEHVGDIVDSSLMVLARKKHKGDIVFSESGQEELEMLFEELFEIFRLSQAVYVSQSPDLANELVDAKHIYRNKIILCREQHTQRLREQVPASLESSQIHVDILRDLQRICSLLVANAYPIIKREGFQ
ncbi:Na/Pi cotransporter family protein [Marinomonas sp. 2405UD68-3]|uniref:Na/Pi cotransporter family protein n=1 Tax=Marinomonas sp. 2405UD68-3 TaxID=3391835 RepID=UPI0039C93A6E